MGELTMLFAGARAGDDEAVGRIFEILYPDVKALARARLWRSQRLTMMDTTLVVHDCFLRFQSLGQVRLEDKQHFLAYAAKVIRTVIVDIVRHEQAQKRGGDLALQTLDTAIIESASDDRADILAVAEAVQALAAVDARLASVVEMRYFAGFSDAEIAQALGLTERTVRRDWDKARAFLVVALKS